MDRMVNTFVYIDIYRQGTIVQVGLLSKEECSVIKGQVLDYWKQYDTEVRGILDTALVGGDMSKNRFLLYTAGQVPGELLSGRRLISGDIEIECTLRK